VVLYETRHNGINYNLGTSGFLYRSNKLMYDKKTSSMWSTLKGEPVIGPLVGKGIRLKRGSVVTTTWGEWLKRHPDTSVLSLKTGHRRNYGEGVAYNDYFSTDRLMFGTPYQDKRLPNKREVLALRTLNYEHPTAIDTEFLKTNPTYSLKIGDNNIIVLSTKKGAIRVFDSKNIKIVSWDGKNLAKDSTGASWKVTESELVQSDKNLRLPRYPSHQSFWFGWYAQFPETRLIR